MKSSKNSDLALLPLSQSDSLQKLKKRPNKKSTALISQKFPHIIAIDLYSTSEISTITLSILPKIELYRPTSPYTPTPCFRTYPAGDDPRLKEETHGDREEPHPWYPSGSLTLITARSYHLSSRLRRWWERACRRRFRRVSTDSVRSAHTERKVRVWLN